MTPGHGCTALLALRLALSMDDFIGCFVSQCAVIIYLVTVSVTCGDEAVRGNVIGCFLQLGKLFNSD